MYTYNKNDKSYTFSFDEIDIDKNLEVDENNEELEEQPDNDKEENTIEDYEPYEPSSVNPKAPRKIEVINGGNKLDISPASDYIEIEKPKNEKKKNIVIPEDNK